MRMITFSILRHFKCNALAYNISRRLKSDAVDIKSDDLKTKGASPDPDYIEVLPSWPEGEISMRIKATSSMRIYPNFVTEEEESSLLSELEPQLKRLRYEYDHWDNAIEGYRETERDSWNEQNAAILKRVRETAFSPHAELLPRAHVLDLAAAGYIKPHIDAVRFCGNTIAGLCLLSSAVMRLVHEARPELQLDALLERRCLYIMRDVSRYEFTHAVLGGEQSVWRGARLPRRRRIALICRERPRPEHCE
ncbi:PREDICTED: alpha-ketoglutarate-dependent dioxygenase alkB homolog 7, mitochondrial [Papilio polytes]|uniref:alpha-ketoglutarate-dependent dioxygenase alkB homolog 7, mitochondrial n=1 Tax=Papilio polytes TaxID=76194 RepID=UPI000675C59B|nr:PREDICTED: alpha-ketoglutarate-dependent dioxygenase alkB homolog 7, mitochondrial [Papilio polytes]